MLPRGVPRFDSLDRVFEGPLQHAPPDRSEHETDRTSLQILALPNDDHVDIGRAIWVPGSIPNPVRTIVQHLLHKHLFI